MDSLVPKAKMFTFMFAVALLFTCSPCFSENAVSEGVLNTETASNVNKRYGINDQLIEAVTAGNAALVRDMIEKGADVNAKATLTATHHKGWTPLILAAHKGHIEVARELIKSGANVNAMSDREGGDGYQWGEDTALTMAAGAGHEEIVRFLIENGADIHAKNYLGTTPILIAGRGKSAAILNELIKRGADINVQDEDGWTPLISAAYNARLENVKALVENGAKINAFGSNSASALVMVGMAQRDPESGETEIKAAEADRRSIVRYLVSKGANLEQEGQAALITASEYGHAGIVQALIDMGVNVKGTQVGTDALVGAVRGPAIDGGVGGNLDVVRILIEHGADPNAESGMHAYHCNIPLDCAIKDNYPNIVTFFLEHNKKICKPDIH